MKNHLLAVALCFALAACGGGGGDETAPPVAGGCPTPPISAGTQVGHTLVASDVHTFPDPTGVQDRLFAPIVYANSGASDVLLQVVSESQRAVQTPSGLAGPMSLQLAISVVDQTNGQLVSPGLCDVPAPTFNPDSNSTVSESIIFNIAVPAGHTFQFTPLARIAAPVGSTGNVVLTTTNFDLSATAI